MENHNRKNENLTVEFKGEKFYTEIENGLIILRISNKGIRSFHELIGLEYFTSLQKLVLSQNNIIDLKGIENLTNLQELDLSLNKIKNVDEIKHLINLKRLNLGNNPIYYDLIEEFGHNYGKNPQRIVEFVKSGKSADVERLNYIS